VTLLRCQIIRTNAHYARGMAGIQLLPRDCQLPITIAALLYRRILVVIERQGYDVLHRRASTSAFEKLQTASAAIAAHWWAARPLAARREA
jgi:phytoene synthase